MNNLITKIANGVPTAPDVKKLVETFGVPKVDDIITYVAIAEAINTQYKSNRYITVVAAWKKYIKRTYGIKLLPQNNTEFCAATSEKWIDYCQKRMISGLKVIAKNMQEATIYIDRHELSPEGQRKYDHVTVGGAVLGLQARVESKRHMMPNNNKRS